MAPKSGAQTNASTLESLADHARMRRGKKPHDPKSPVPETTSEDEPLEVPWAEEIQAPKDILQWCIYFDTLIERLGRHHDVNVSIRVESDDELWIGYHQKSDSRRLEKTLPSGVAKTFLRDCGLEDERARRKMIASCKRIVQVLEQWERRAHSSQP